MDKPLYDPHLKYQIASRIGQVLFDPLKEALNSEIDAIATKNCHLQGLAHKSFLYKGERYNLDTTPAPLRSNRLANSLKGEMDEFLAKMKDFRDYEEITIMGYVSQVLNLCSHPRDCLRMLPSGLHPHLQDVLPASTTQALSESIVQETLQKNQKPFQMIKERMALNLLLR